MPIQNEGDLLKLLMWIADNPQGWKYVCGKAVPEPDELLETLQSLKDARLYQPALILLTMEARHAYLHDTLLYAFCQWYEEQKPAAAVFSALTQRLGQKLNIKLDNT